MNTFESMDDAVQAIWACQDESERQEYTAIGHMVNDLFRIAQAPEVYARHDGHLGLPQRLSSAFLSAHPSQADNPEFEEDFVDFLEEVETVTALALQPLSQEQQEEIEEERKYMGDDPDPDAID